MSVCELCRVTLYDTDAVYALICELKQGQFDLQTFSAGYAANLQDPNVHYQLAQLDGQVVGLVGLHLQFHLYHVNWVDEIQKLVVMPQARGLTVDSQLLAWAEATMREVGAEMTELSTSTQRLNAHRLYQRGGYTQSHFRFTKPLWGESRV